MVKKLFLKIFIASLLSLPNYLSGQDWTIVKEIKLNGTPTSFSTDIKGNIYLGFQDGRLTEYTSVGDRLENFALSNKSAITLIDAQNSLKPFLFYFDNQQITILDRFSSVPKTYPLADLGFMLVTMACPAPDGDFWILENNPQRLFKISPLRKSILLEVQVKLGDHICQMRTYQNLLLIGDNIGLKIFDQFGSRLFSIKLDDLTNFQIVNEKVYAHTASEMIVIDPFTGTVESRSKSPASSIASIKNRENLILIDNQKMVFYEK